MFVADQQVDIAPDLVAAPAVVHKETALEALLAVSEVVID